MFENTVVCGHIVLGKQGENHARKISFTDAKVWVNMFGEGRFELLHQRNGDSVPYPIELNTEGDVPQWHISSVDTAIAGNGECELRYIVGDTIVKSCTFTTEVAPGLIEGTEIPDPFKAWVDEVLGAAEEVKTATVNQPIIGENGNWFVYDFNEGDYVDTGISATGGGGSDADLTDYVKNTDYATGSKGGVVKVYKGYGLEMGSSGTITTTRATEAEIDARTQGYNVITPKNLEYAVKSVGDKIYASADVVGDIDTALDTIIAMQNNLIGGDA